MLNKFSVTSWFTIALALTICSVAYGGVHIFDTSYPPILPNTGVGLALALLAFGAGIFSVRKGGAKISINLELMIAALAIVMLSDISTRLHNLFQLYFSPALLVALMTSLGAVILIARTWGLALALVLAVGGALIGFVGASNGQLLFSDDHPSFLYRLVQLRDNFPNIPFYNPFWNSGVEAREFFPSGILNVYFLFLPLVYFGDIITNYNTLVFLLLFVITPAAAYLTARVNAFSVATGLMAAILSLSTSLLWYRWALTFGTVGFITSTIFLPLGVGSLVRILESDKASWCDCLVFALSISLVVLWPLSTLAIIPLIPYVLFRIKRIFSAPRVIATFVGLALVHLPWMLMFSKASSVGNFVASASEDGKQALPYLALIREHCESANPLLLFLAIPGLLLIRPGILSRVLASQAVWLGFLAVFVSTLKPQMELDRFILVLWHLLVFPTTVTIYVAFQKINGAQLTLKSTKFWLTSFVLGFLAIIPIQTYFMAGNQTVIKSYFQSSLVDEMVSAINSLPSGGRVMFAGFILHELDHGHVALLAARTNKPLIASSYQHNLWKYRDIIPDEFLIRKEAGINEYLSLMNVTAVITHDPRWRKYFTARPESFRLKWRADKFSIFERLQPPDGYFLDGSGELIRQEDNLLELRVNQPSAVVKFNYYDFLESSNCKIAPYSHKAPLKMIALSECDTTKNVTIRAASMRKRLIAW